MSGPSYTEGDNIARHSRMTSASRDLLHSFSEWGPLAHFESIKHLLFSPLSTDRLYKSDTMGKALQLMHTHQVKDNRRSLAYMPSGDELLTIEIPESRAPFSLFQGFKATFPASDDDANGKVDPESLAGCLHRREKLVKESQRIQVQKSLTLSELTHLEQQLNELLSKRAKLEEAMTHFEVREGELIDLVEELDEKIRSFTEGSEGNSDDEFEQITDQILASVGKRSKGRRHSSHRLDESIIMVNEGPVDSEEEEWDFGDCIGTLKDHDDMIICLDFDSPQGILVTSAYDSTVRVWDLSERKTLGVLTAHQDKVRCIQLLEGSKLITGSDDRTVKIWDLHKIDENNRREPYEQSITSAHPEDEAAAEEEEAKDAEEQEVDKEDDLEAAPVAISSSVDDLHRMDYCLSMTIEGHRGEVTALYAEDGSLVTGSSDQTMRQWDLNTGQEVMTLDIMWTISSSSASRNRSAAWGSTSMYVDSRVDQTMANPMSMSVSSIDPAGVGLFAGSIYGESVGDFVGALQFWNFALASGTSDGNIRMWDLRTGQAHRTLTGHTGAITCLQFDHTHIVSGSLDRSIRIWDLRTGSVFDTFSYEHGVADLQFDSNKIVCATGSDDVKIYNRLSFQNRSFTGHTDALTAVRFRDNMLISGSKDCTVKLWGI